MSACRFKILACPLLAGHPGLALDLLIRSHCDGVLLASAQRAPEALAPGLTTVLPHKQVPA